MLHHSIFYIRTTETEYNDTTRTLVWLIHSLDVFQESLPSSKRRVFSFPPLDKSKFAVKFTEKVNWKRDATFPTLAISLVFIFAYILTTMI